MLHSLSGEFEWNSKDLALRFDGCGCANAYSDIGSSLMSFLAFLLDLFCDL